MECFNFVSVAFIPQMPKWARTSRNYTYFNNIRYSRAKRISATDGLDGAYHQVILCTTGPMSCAKYGWSRRRLSKFSSSYWGKLGISEFFFQCFSHITFEAWPHAVLPKTVFCLFLKRVMSQNFWMQSQFKKSCNKCG